MIPAEVTETRTLTIVLPESEWRALRAEEPDAVAWLQAQIRKRLEAAGAPPVPAAESYAAYDDY